MIIRIKLSYCCDK